MQVYLDIIGHCIAARSYGNTLALDFDDGSYLDLDVDDQAYQEALTACQDINLLD